MKWKKVADNVIKSGEVWSIKGFQPGYKDISKILTLAGGTCCIARAGQNIMRYKDWDFVETLEYFDPKKKRFLKPKQQEALSLVREEPVYVGDLARKLYTWKWLFMTDTDAKRAVWRVMKKQLGDYVYSPKRAHWALKNLRK